MKLYCQVIGITYDLTVFLRLWGPKKIDILLSNRRAVCYGANRPGEAWKQRVQQLTATQANKEEKK